MKSDPSDCDSCLGPPGPPEPPGSGLSRVPFRTGTHPTLFDAMVGSLSAVEVPEDGAFGPPVRPLAKLGTRSTDDPSIALLDLWASALHVLSFYQEAALNEAYLGTAEERFSLVELAHTVGHQPDPGVSAEAWLAFQMNDLTGRQAPTPLDARTPVQGLPAAATAPPPLFETLEDTTLHPEWSELRPLHTRPAYLAIVRPRPSDGDGQLYWIEWEPGPGPETEALPTDQVHPVNLSADVLTGPQVYGRPVHKLALKSALTPVKPGDTLLFRSPEGDGAFAMLKVSQVTPEPLKDQVVVTLDQPRKVDPPLGSAPDLPRLTVEVESLVTRPLDELVRTLRAHTLTEDEAQRLVAAYRPGARELRDLLADLDPYAVQGEDRGMFLSVAMFRPFGHDAQDSKALTNAIPDQTFTWDDTPPTVWENASGTDRGVRRLALDRVSTRSAVGAAVVLEGPKGLLYDDDLFNSGFVSSNLQLALSQLQGTTRAGGLQSTGREIVVVDVVPEAAPLATRTVVQLYTIRSQVDAGLKDFYRSTSTTLLDLDKAAGTGSPNGFPFRQTTIRLFTDAVHAGPRVVDEAVEGQAVMLERFHPDLRSGQALFVSGVPVDATGGRSPDPEFRTILRVEHVGGRTVLTLDQPLAHRYRRDSVILNANVVRAIHGETLEQVLGDGDSRQSHQRFELRRPPLSHRASAIAPQPEVEIRVDGVAWSRVDTLFGQRPDARVYVLRQRSDEQWEVRFGDGERGARLPTGQANVFAVWRSGVGTDGNAKANTLSTLRSQPFGVRTVTNPLPATGGVDPKAPAELRHAVPRRTRTLGRVVALTDIEDFARDTPGVSKASAVSVAWRGGPLALVTVAADGVDPDVLRSRLQQGLRAVAPPGLRVAVQAHLAAFFVLELRIEVDEAHVPSVVRDGVAERLRRAFAFAQRAFGQPVTRSEVLHEASSQLGVRGVFIDRFERSDGPVSPTASFLPARRSGVANGELQPAELLLLDPSVTGLTIAIGGGAA